MCKSFACVFQWLDFLLMVAWCTSDVHHAWLPKLMTTRRINRDIVKKVLDLNLLGGSMFIAAKE